MEFGCGEMCNGMMLDPNHTGFLSLSLFNSAELNWNSNVLHNVRFDP